MRTLRFFCHKGLSALVCVTIGFFLMTPVVFAETPTPTTCDCYCATSAGANKLAEQKTPDTCLAACKVKGKSMVVCAFSNKPEQSPDRSPYCYTEEQCTKQNGVLDAKQAWDCISGQKYCFPDPNKAAKVTLNVSIPNPANPSKPLTLTGDIGEYINSMFFFMINSGMVIAIVMVMIGGLQYTLGASSKDGVSKGKDRIKNGITGLVLLLCVHLIAQTVNPYLVRMQLPKFPMVKPIGLPEGASSCEQYKEKKDKDGKVLYKLEKDPGKCGESSSVAAAEGQPAVAGGISCDYKEGCPTGQGCAGSGSTAKCVECVALTKDNTLGLKPSSSICDQLTPKPPDVKNAAIIRCGYTEDTDMISGNVAGAGAVLTGGTCAQVTINCADIDDCESYDKQVEVKNNAKTQPLEDIQNTQLGVNKGNFGLESICNENPCGLHFPKGGEAFTAKCKFSTGTYGLKDDCVAGSHIELDGTDYEPGNY